MEAEQKLSIMKLTWPQSGDRSQDFEECFAAIVKVQRQGDNWSVTLLDWVRYFGHCDSDLSIAVKNRGIMGYRNLLMPDVLFRNLPRGPTFPKSFHCW